jgi:hypothetical protein
MPKRRAATRMPPRYMARFPRSGPCSAQRVRGGLRSGAALAATGGTAGLFCDIRSASELWHACCNSGTRAAMQRRGRRPEAVLRSKRSLTNAPWKTNQSSSQRSLSLPLQTECCCSYPLSKRAPVLSLRWFRPSAAKLSKRVGFHARAVNPVKLRLHDGGSDRRALRNPARRRQ